MRAMFAARASVDEVAAALGRTPAAIVSRCCNLGTSPGALGSPRRAARHERVTLSAAELARLRAVDARMALLEAVVREVAVEGVEFRPGCVSIPYATFRAACALQDATVPLSSEPLPPEPPRGPMSSLSDLYHRTAAAWRFDRTNYPHIPLGADRAYVALFALRHIAMHATKTTGRLVALIEPLDHGRDLPADFREACARQVAHSILNALRFAAIVGVTVEDIEAAIAAWEKEGAHSEPSVSAREAAIERGLGYLRRIVDAKLDGGAQ